jgi:solute carrier family 25 (mitochondrial oxoglutarate transporter), member 11
MNFLIGGLSGMIATTCIQPIDCIKVQIQVRSEAGVKNLSPFSIAREIYATKGSIKPFYAGLDSALLRQAVYTSTRLGLFYQIKDTITKKTGKAPSTLQNAIASLLSGGIGAFVGNPADLALVRMQSDLNAKPEDKRNYKHVGDALMRTVKEEGIFTLWRGSMPTVARAMSMNFSLLVPFEFMKKFFEPYISSARNRTFAASMVSGICACILSLPFDNVKTKLQKMKKGPSGEFPYNGVIDCMKKTALKEGPLKLWVGINTYYFRVAPHAIISLVTNEFLRNTLIHNKK